MSLRLILGRAGTGKTHLCLQEMADHLNREGETGPPLFLLVPEQATFQIERELLGRLKRRGTTRGHVLSFRRLAYRILSETGGAALPAISDSGKRMVLRAVLSRRREDLRVFAGSAAKPGFASQLTYTIGELRSHGIIPESLRSTAASVADDSLAGKLHDLALLLTEYENRIANKFSDPDRYLELASQRFGQAKAWHGARVWVDGFATFTPVEYRLLMELLLRSEQVSVALLLDGTRPLGQPPREADLFQETHETYHRLLAMARQGGVPVTPDVVLDVKSPPNRPPRFKNSPDLAHIEANFFSSSPGRTGVVPKVAGGLKLVSAADPAAEVEAVAGEITRLLRDRGYRPRDISVIVRRLEPYDRWINRIFADYGIPYFIDRRREVIHHPLIQLLRSVMEVIVSDWPLTPLFNYLKTGLIPVPRDQIDRLENYVLAFGIQGFHWYDGKQWTFARTPEERRVLPEINRIKDTATSALVQLHRRLAGIKTSPQRFGAALMEHLLALDVPGQLWSWQRQAEQQGDLEASRLHRQVWDGIVRLLDEISDAFSNQTLSTAEYRQILDAGLQELDIGLIPPALDQVLVAAIDRSRQPNVRAAFIIGANEGVFPAAVAEDPLLSDDDRQALAAVGMELGVDSKRLLFRERLLTYIALTRPSDYLWVSYSRTDGNGGALSPSPIVSRLQRLFGNLAETVLPASPTAPGEVEHPQRLASGLLAHLRRQRDRAANPRWDWLGAYQWLVSQDGKARKWRRLLLSLTEPRPIGRLSPATRQLLLGARAGQDGGPAIIPLTVTRLETYAACPFQHFAAYDLGLRERARPEPDAASIGAFLHDALYMLTRHLMESGIDWVDLTASDRRQLVDSVFNRLSPAWNEAAVTGSATYRQIMVQLRRLLYWLTDLLTEHARRGDFRPVGLELSFGGSSSPLPPLSLDLDEHVVQLRGRIDRVDIADIDGERWVRVIDYKSGQRTLSLADISYGLSLQLPLYLTVVLQHGSRWLGSAVRPAGAYFFPLAEPVVDEAAAETEAGDEAKAANAWTGRAGAVSGREQRLPRSRLAAARMSGLTVDHPPVIKAMDREISGWSDIINAGFSEKSGTAYSSPLTAPEPAIKALTKYAVSVAGQIATQLLSGQVAPRPYRTPSGEVPCRYCPYSGVCRFEPIFGGHRELPSMDPKEIWQTVVGSNSGGNGR